MNYHTHGNLLIHPWGYTDAPTPEDNLYFGIAREMTKENSYPFGNGTVTLGSLVNGDSDDWMYGEEGTKNRIYAMTPEVGAEGFWPPIDRIVFNCQANVHANVSNAFMLLNYPILESSSIETVDEFTADIELNFSQLGFQADVFDVEVEVVSGNANLSQVNFSYDMEQLETATENISLLLDDDLTFGEEIIIAVTSTDAGNIINDTLTYEYSFGGLETFLVQDIIGDDEFWVADNENWFYATDLFVSEEFSLSESPSANYQPGTNKSIQSKSIVLPEEGELRLKFDMWVEIESNYDYAALYINTIGNPLIPLCGNYSDAPQNSQPEGVPVYDGSFGWVSEEIDVTAWAGMEVVFTLQFVSDNFVNGEGIYIDNWAITTTNEITPTGETEIVEFRPSPNPATNIVQLNLPFNRIEKVEVYNALGQRMMTEGKGISSIDVSGLTNGVYYILVENTDGGYHRGQVVVGK